jgi:hypothetical protein
MSGSYLFLNQKIDLVTDPSLYDILMVVSIIVLFFIGVYMHRRSVTLSREEIKRCFKKSILDLTPYKNGSCKESGCRGVVVKTVISSISSFSFYSTPRCSLCGKVYLSTPLTVSKN